MVNQCKELCNQDLEQEVLGAEKNLIQQRLALHDLKKEVIFLKTIMNIKYLHMLTLLFVKEDRLVRSIQETAREFDNVQVTERREMLFTEAEELKLNRYRQQTNEYFENAPEFSELNSLSMQLSTCVSQNWSDVLADLQESESEASRENQLFRREILDASTISHEYRMRIKTAKSNLARLLSSSHLERRQLEGQIAESLAARRSLEKSIPELDSQVKTKRGHLIRLERELHRLRCALRCGD